MMVGTESLAEDAGGNEAETGAELATRAEKAPIAGLAAVLSRIPGATRATAGNGVRIGDIENSMIYGTVVQ